MRWLSVAFVVSMSTVCLATVVEKANLNQGKTPLFLQLPDKEQKHPVVIIAPGQGYHMGQPLIRGLSQQLGLLKIGSIRFNWSFFTEKGDPSDRFARERKDLDSVISWARKHKHIDSEKIILVGKSLGSIVSSQKFADDKELFALVALTPVCFQTTTFETYYPVAKESRNVLFYMGREDRVCPFAKMQKHMQDIADNPKIVFQTQEGNHSLKVASGKPQNHNLKAATINVAQWIEALVFSN